MTLAGLLAPVDGTVTLGDVPLTSCDDHQLRATIGYFAEDAHVFATTVRDNLLVVRGDCTDAELTDALSRVGLGPWVTGLPDGLATVVDVRRHGSCQDRGRCGTPSGTVRP